LEARVGIGTILDNDSTELDDNKICGLFGICWVAGSIAQKAAQGDS
jgi:hypothetical protein